jgi:hypothetical protein
MATYVNDLRLTELATGEGSGTWGTTTNTSLELIGEALGYATQQAFGSDADATTTVADGASDPARAMYYKITSAASLTATRTLTIAPNTISRVMFIENATSGSQSIAISQGSGANVTIATGKTAVVYLDGAGATAAVVDAMSGVDPGVTDTLTEVLVAGNTSGGTNIELSTTDKVQFRDAAIYLNSSVDGQLDIVADTEIQIAATTVDLNGDLDVSGTALVTGVLTTTAATVFNGGFASNADSTLGTDKKVQFRDSAIYINSSVDGQLDIVADTEIQIAATTVDLNGNLDVSGTALVAGVLTTTAATVFNGGFASNADSTLGTDKKVQFRDSAIYINSSADGQLDIVADTEIQIAATTIDINGAINASGEIIAASLDVSGDIDVDGTANLDVVDIDGAVNMATTALVTGVLTTTAATVFNGGFASNAASTISTADNTDTLTLISTDADAAVGPILNLYRNSSSPANNDLVGQIKVVARNNNSQDVEVFRIDNYIVDVTDGSEDCTGGMYQMRAGTMRETLTFGATEFVINDDGLDYNFRVESDGNTNMLFVDAGNNRVGVGSATPSSVLEVTGTFAVRSSSSSTFNDSSNAENVRMLDAGTIFNADGIDKDFTVASNDNANMLFVDGGNNRVHFGSNANIENNRVQVTAPKSLVGGIPQQSLGVNDSTAMAEGVGGSIDFTGQYLDNGTYTSFASVEAYKTNASSGNYDGTLVLKARQHGGDQVDKLRLNFTEAVFNEDGLDTDFRVESDTNANAIFMDASLSCVGINKSPAVELDVQQVSTSYPLRISASGGVSRSMVFADSEGSPSRVNWLAGAQYNTDNGWELTPSTANGGYTFTNRVLTAYANGNLTVNENGINADFRVESETNAHGFFLDASRKAVGVNFDSNPGAYSQFAVRFSGSDSDVNTTGVAIQDSGTNSNISFCTFFNSGGGGIGSITRVGTTNAVAYNTTSDRRAKENIADADDAGAVIDAIQVRKFDWIEGNQHQPYGMVAQELITVAPEAVHQPANEEDMMGVDYSKLVPMLIKEIQSLRARVADLES